MSWLYLVLAGISELGWPLGFKMSAMAQAQNNTMHTVLWLGLALLSMVTSMAFLYLAQRHIHIYRLDGDRRYGDGFSRDFLFPRTSYPDTSFELDCDFGRTYWIEFCTITIEKTPSLNSLMGRWLLFIVRAKTCVSEVIRGKDRRAPSQS